MGGALKAPCVYAGKWLVAAVLDSPKGHWLTFCPWGSRLEAEWRATVTGLSRRSQVSRRSCVWLSVGFLARVFAGCAAWDGGLLCSWLYMKVSWWALVTEPITSSSLLSDALGEAELGLVSIAAAGSGSEPESDWLE